GRLTDGQGRTVDFRNTILILTSNLGSQYLVEPSPSSQLRSSGGDPTSSEEVKRQQVLGVVRASFKPEFLNRLDDLVVFSALTREQLAHIAELQIAGLARRLADRRITLDVTPAALEWLAEEGNDPAYGARPLRRLIQTAIGDRLAKGILAGAVRDGDTVRLDGADLCVRG
ncbi:AAA family ATPase, partial [Streptomyces sp. NPDC002506]|uniref:AAA family ATPase n=1 Tax=Streptomyces sp. NPDC002506 TaxID=3154536 RepID=UPI0033239385